MDCASVSRINVSSTSGSSVPVAISSRTSFSAARSASACFRSVMSRVKQRVCDRPSSAHHVGADEDVPDGAVLAPQPGLVAVQLLAFRQPAQDVADHGRVGVELGDVVADVLVGG